MLRIREEGSREEVLDSKRRRIGENDRKLQVTEVKFINPYGALNNRVNVENCQKALITRSIDNFCLNWRDAQEKGLEFVELDFFNIQLNVSFRNSQNVDFDKNLIFFITNFINKEFLSYLTSIKFDRVESANVKKIEKLLSDISINSNILSNLKTLCCEDIACDFHVRPFFNLTSFCFRNIHHNIDVLEIFEGLVILSFEIIYGDIHFLKLPNSLIYLSFGDIYSQNIGIDFSSLLFSKLKFFSFGTIYNEKLRNKFKIFSELLIVIDRIKLIGNLLVALVQALEKNLE